MDPGLVKQMLPITYGLYQRSQGVGWNIITGDKPFSVRRESCKIGRVP